MVGSILENYRKHPFIYSTRNLMIEFCINSYYRSLVKQNTIAENLVLLDVKLNEFKPRVTKSSKPMSLLEEYMNCDYVNVPIKRSLAK